MTNEVQQFDWRKAMRGSIDAMTPEQLMASELSTEVCNAAGRAIGEGCQEQWFLDEAQEFSRRVAAKICSPAGSPMEGE
jgi:hypothetical protein